MDYHLTWTSIGLAVLILTNFDAVLTTLLLNGSGPISGPVSNGVGRLSMRAPGAIAKNASILALLATFVLWTWLLWLGWVLVFCGSETAVIESSTKSPANLTERIYFAGFSITTLGTGNYVPKGPAWEIFSVIAAANGFFQVAVYVTYVFSVLTALNERRKFGVAVGQMGRTPIEMILLARQGSQRGFSSSLDTLTHELQLASLKTDTYPVLEYTHVIDHTYSFAVAVALLGEMLCLEEALFPNEESLAANTRMPLRRALSLLLDEKDIDVPEEPPAIPNIQPLREAGLPVADGWEQSLSSAADFRKQLLAWLHWHHRDWSDVYSTTQ